MDFLIRLVQVHETFRQPEIEALSKIAKVKFETIFYSQHSPLCVVRFKDVVRDSHEEIARRFIKRSILSRGIYELWGVGSSYDELHQDVYARTEHLWNAYKHVSFKFLIDGYLGKRSSTEQREIINSFSYLGFQGKINMKHPEVIFTVFEEWDVPLHDVHATMRARSGPKRLLFGREIGFSSRDLVDRHDLKKRPYISTTSMDAELALVTANLALAGPGKLFMDPFVGTGGFLVAAAELGAMVLGSDIDGRSFRGKGTGVKKGIGANFKQYRLEGSFVDCITSDLTNSPLRHSTSILVHQGRGEDGRWLDGIICDPPYGVREGLKVLGNKTETLSNGQAVSQVQMIDGVLAHTLDTYIAPKKAYSFTRMLDDILDFAARTLVNGGRLAFWMPTSNDDEEILIPQHRCLELLHGCVQPFNKWSRRLLVYQRIDGEVAGIVQPQETVLNGKSADELNPFRRKYFQGFLQAE